MWKIHLTAGRFAIVSFILDTISVLKYSLKESVRDIRCWSTFTRLLHTRINLTTCQQDVFATGL
jgi:hypothetical protein